MRVALRVEVRSLRGIREGVPNLIQLFGEYRVRASFFFPLGRDYAGRSPADTWRKRHGLGLTALAYGTLIPAPSLGAELAVLMETLRAGGHEVGLFGLSPGHWARRLAFADPGWVSRQCEDLWASYRELAGEIPSALATPDWQVNPALLGELVETRCRYSSLTRGRLPYYPVLQGARSCVPEIPTTLPTVDELLRQKGVSGTNVHEYLYAESRYLLPAGHVYAASAEREGMEMLDLMERMLIMWKGQDGAVRTLGEVLHDIDSRTIPHHQIGWGSPPGSDVSMAMQSVQVPA